MMANDHALFAALQTLTCWSWHPPSSEALAIKSINQSSYCYDLGTWPHCCSLIVQATMALFRPGVNIHPEMI